MALKLRKGQKFGDWQLREFLGEGGNGFVWLASGSTSNEAAVKILAKFDGKSKSKVYARFRNEVEVVQANSDIGGILPILDCHLPDEITEDLPWYAMPVAQPLDKYLKDKNFEVAVQVVLKIGKALAELHTRGVCHRDVKPANILVKDDKFYLTDFGLVDYPDKLDITSMNEQIGARWTMAPEMKRSSHTADGKLADVYSLAKTLWILLTGRKDGFEGQYDPAGINGLQRLRLTEIDDEEGYYDEKPRLAYIKPLDDLLRVSTDDDPRQRPNMRQFIESLAQWIDTYKDFEKCNRLQWHDIQTRLFPFAMPQRAFWENIDRIIEILDYLGSVSDLNHMLLPGGGGMDVLGARKGLESNTIELLISGSWVYIVRPKRLVFENFDFDWSWNYFRLETGDLQRTDISSVSRFYEDLVEIAPLHYISIDAWYEDQDGERAYPPESREVCRYLNGTFLILQKTSVYNRIPDTYDGRHNQMGTDEFREYISEMMRYNQSH